MGLGTIARLRKVPKKRDVQEEAIVIVQQLVLAILIGRGEEATARRAERFLESIKRDMISELDKFVEWTK